LIVRNWLEIAGYFFLFSFALMQKKQKIKAEFIFAPFFDPKLGNKEPLLRTGPSGQTAFVSNPI
jgi:hypothetical protein